MTNQLSSYPNGPFNIVKCIYFLLYVPDPDTRPISPTPPLMSGSSSLTLSIYRNREQSELESHYLNKITLGFV